MPQQPQTEEQAKENSFLEAGLKRFYRDTNVECREIWRNVYAAVIAGQAVQTQGVQGNWSSDSSGQVSNIHIGGAVQHQQAAEAADIAVHNYKTMIGRTMGGGTAKSYVQHLPPTPTPESSEEPGASLVNGSVPPWAKF